MFDKKSIFVLVSAVLLIVLLIVWGLQDEPRIQDDSSEIVYYYGEGCPHCKVIDEFLEANAIAEKVSFSKKEVWNDRKNAAELSRRAKTCNVEPSGMGVPFVYGGDGRCYIGEPDVKKFFSEKAGISVAEEK